MALDRLHLEDLQEVIVLFARGYTMGKIRKHLMTLAAEHGRMDLVPTEMDLLKLAIRYSDDVELVRQNLARDVLTRGLARKEERILRYTEMAESLEDAAMSGMNLKASEAYRRVLRDVREEVDGLNIKILLPGDEWAQLLQGLKEKADSLVSSPKSLPTPDTTPLE